MILCADIGGSYIDFAEADPSHHLAHRQRLPTPTSDLEGFVSALNVMTAGYDPAIPLHMAIAGVCAPDTGRTRTANIPCVNDVPMRELLTRRLGRHVLVANDAHCFALSEAMQGVGKGHEIVFGVILGTGVGGGLIIHGRPVIGRGGLGGEWGHGPFIAQATGADAIPCLPCQCGQHGCLDTIGGARGIERLHRHLGNEALHARDLLANWQSGEAAARRTVDVWLDRMSAGLAMVANVTGASIMPVGGGLAHQVELIGALDRMVRGRILRQQESALVVPASLPADSGLIGASWLRD
ncbi:ROK family protein [Novacetimonas maltaceti]|uniref:N-acetyl-D-glucosamine kinase n=1 Tax=Novacetimonas maltaceti TaxID=1203393 RepID=A0A2S3W4Z4_9PROT|nr:ROK family protein [Novacetimonas maltaceti]POF63945.1 N-acetyl-D-glucosamine kinase [Novacetimonas maltaceti]